MCLEGEPFAADLPEGSTLKRPQTPPEGSWGMVGAQDSPAVSSSEVSSPSVTPANFDFQKPEPSDPVCDVLYDGHANTVWNLKIKSLALILFN